MSNNFFITEEENNTQSKELNNNLQSQNVTTNPQPKKETKAPPDYIPIRLNSLGKLSAPKILHFRDYNMEDALDLSLSNDENRLSILITILNRMVWEGFDCAYLTEKELEEIMLTIFANFWSPSIEKIYPYEEEELKEIKDEKRIENIKAGKDILTVFIPLSSIKTKPITDEFKEPFTITYKNGKEVKFILPRINHQLIANDYVNDKFAKEDLELSDIKETIEYNEKHTNNKLPISKEDKDKYKKHTIEKAKLYLKITQAQLLIKINSKKLNTIEDQIKAYSEISLSMWKEYNNTISKYANYGVENDIEVISPITNKKVIRRFQFRFMDFIPDMDLQNDTENTIIFGD